MSEPVAQPPITNSLTNIKRTLNSEEDIDVTDESTKTKINTEFAKFIKTETYKKLLVTEPQPLNFYFTKHEIYLIKGEEYHKWFLSWNNLLRQEYDFSDKNILSKIAKKMREFNPYIIAQNHIVQEVIDAGNNLDFQPLENFLKVLKKPFHYDEKNIFYHTPPASKQKVLQTFCGT